MVSTSMPRVATVNKPNIRLKPDGAVWAGGSGAGAVLEAVLAEGEEHARDISGARAAQARERPSTVRRIDELRSKSGARALAAQTGLV